MAPAGTSPLLRPRDSDALRGELRRTAAEALIPVVFAGEVRDGNLHLTEFFGTRTNALEGVVVPPRAGLGGLVVDRARPATVPDYGRSSSITHHFDRPVLGEGLRSILAVPVMVSGAARAVLYGAIRECSPLGDRAVGAFVQAARRLSSEIAVRDEVDRRLAMLGSLDRPVESPVAAAQIRDVHAELRGLAQCVEDAGLQRKLRDLSDRLAGALGGAAPLQSDVVLSPRETDVLAHVALGCTNAEIADRLSVGPETVKSYLRSAMGKLDAHTRHEAVVSARRLGLLP
ncbi:LuxR C-terminal-related transcriptional regulator [Rhodococcus ruber]|uniref:LuxR family transcriptional regulator n=1 Tax=Rhodococcus ruber TaxID=1830 RepID=A0A098BIZ9_9NOCA|nr:MULTISPECIES: LuxR C-terminal-related transcriptional regulator [Rhodococcus]MDO2379178.1 LuxR C-terminal-related transcriptional regulator [Rhodococcus ruber]MDX5310532.1 LuxR C-terminal-related transcriptional regulator [Rhodococcus sp. (in: high G+C Gram-positive bacteria)]MBP2211274.1 DNA-binding CsgD family transcriptional regulator [Rhodococcus ruber]MCD2126316.1 LuxR C-terminal-related transcriptional regulator [Rhodococcus ruber]MCZ1074001.1 LuxR C-terminal-related transcriptional r